MFQQIHLSSTNRNDIADRETSHHEILRDIKVAITEHLLQTEGEGTLPQQIDATIYVYRRKDDNRDRSPELNPAVLPEELGYVENTTQERDAKQQD